MQSSNSLEKLDVSHQDFSRKSACHIFSSLEQESKFHYNKTTKKETPWRYICQYCIVINKQCLLHISTFRRIMHFTFCSTSELPLELTARLTVENCCIVLNNTINIKIHCYLKNWPKPTFSTHCIHLIQSLLVCLFLHVSL